MVYGCLVGAKDVGKDVRFAIGRQRQKTYDMDNEEKEDEEIKFVLFDMNNICGLCCFLLNNLLVTC